MQNTFHTLDLRFYLDLLREHHDLQRHFLRNGIAHGNAFNITDDGKKRLAKYEAHNRNAAVKSPLGTTYEITPDLTGPGQFSLILSVLLT